MFIVGAPKCGTTAWFEYLRSHPDIYFPDAKEPTYFASDLPGMRGPTSLDEYQGLFADVADATVLGDASATHLFSNVAAREIRQYNPRAKILIFLRPQEDFLPSLHHHFLSRFEDSMKDFEQAWRLSGRRPPETIPRSCSEPRFLDYAAMARFYEQVARYFAAFPPNQIKVIQFAEWTAKPRATYLEILDFLGLADDGRTDFPSVNEARSFRVAIFAKLLLKPPRWLAQLRPHLKRMAGRNIPKVADWLLRINARKGYRSGISHALREEIRSYYAADNARLRELLIRSTEASARPSRPARNSP